MAFNIEILSKLAIDPRSSASQINKVIKSSEFRNQLDSVKVKLEANLNQKEYQSFRASINKVVKQLSSDSSSSKVKVGVEVDQKKAVTEINSALQRASKQLQKISVDIDARVDKKALQQQLNGTTGSTTSNAALNTEKKVTAEKKEQSVTQSQINNKNRASGDVSEKNLAKIRAMEAALSETGLEFLNINKSFKSSNELASNLEKQFSEAGHEVQKVKTNTIDLDKGMRQATVQVERYNNELKKTQTLTVKAKQDPTGNYNINSMRDVNSAGKQANQSTQQANQLAERQIQQYQKLIATGSRVEDTYKKQIAALRQLQDAQGTSTKEMREEIASQQKAIKADEQHAKAIDFQTKLLHQNTKAMQQNQRYIDRRAMKTLASDIQRVNLSASNAMPQLQAMQGQMQGHVNRAAQATRSQMGIMENFQNALVKFPIWMGASTLFFGAIRSAREFVTNIVEIDSKLITLQKVMSDSANMDEVFNNASQAAERFGQTLSDVLDAYAEFARQGYEGQDLANFGDAALITSNVGEISAQDASNYLTASAAQWKTDSQEAMGNIDAWNELANNYATTVDKLGEGQAKAGATARAMGLDFDETNAIIGSLTAQTKQSGSEIGNFIKSAFPRMYAGTGRGTFEELGISMEAANGETKNAVTLLREASHAMDDLNQADQADAIRGLGGVWHYQRMQVLLETLKDTNGMYDQMLDSSRNSDGSAAAENAVYMESLEARINKAKVAIEEFSLALGEAFLEAGILEFLTSFVDVMTQLTKLFTDISPAMRNAGFGVLIASLATMNKGVRDLYSNLLNLPKAFSAVNNNARKTAAGANAFVAKSQAPTKPMTFATGGMANATKSLETQSKQMMVLNERYQTANKSSKQYATTQSTLSQSSLATSRAQRSASAATGASVVQANLAAKAHRGATAAVRGLGLAFRGLAAATGVGLVIGGITWGLEKLINKSADATQKTNEFEQAQDVLKQNMEADSQQVKDLTNRYGELEAKMSSGDYNSEDLKEYRDVTEQMTQLFPDLVTGSEEYGQSLSGQQSIIQARINLLDQQLKKEKELSRVQQEAALQETADAGVSAEEDLKKDLESLKRDLKQEAQGSLRSGEATDTDMVDNFKEQIDSINTMSDALKVKNQIEEYGRQLSKSDPEEYEKQKVLIDSIVSKIQGKEADLSALNMEVLDGMTAKGQIFLKNAQAAIDSVSGLSGASTNLMGSLTSQVTSLELSGEKTEQIFEGLLTSLSADTGFQEKMATYEAAVTKFQEAATPEEEFAALKEIETAYQDVAASITSSMKDMGVSEDDINKTVGALLAEVDALYGLNGALSDGAGTIDDYEALQNTMKKETEGATDAIDAQKEAITGLVDSFRELDGQMDTLKGAMGEIDENGFLSTDTMYDLLEMYPELLGQQMSAADMQDFLKQKYNEAHSQKMQNYQQELLTSEAAMQNIIADEDHKLHETAKRYGIDLQNYDTVQAAKNDVARLYNTGTVEQQNKIVSALGERYGVDLSNYGNLAEKKAAIENELMKMVTNAWNAHIAQIQSLAPELNAFMKDFEGAEGLAAAKEGIDGLSLKTQVNALNPAFSEVSRKTETMKNALAGIEPMMHEALSLDFGTANVDLQEAAGASGLFDDLSSATGASDILESSLGDLSDSSDVVGSSIDGAGDRAKKAAEKAKKGGKDASKSAKDAADATEEAKEEVKDLNVEVEQQVKTFQKSTFVLNKYEESLRKINVQLEKQNLQTEKYATHSANYRKSLEKENKLNEQKLKTMQAQEKSLESQIKNGKIKEYGMLSEDVNVAYNQYNTSTSGSGSTTRKTGRVTQSAPKGKVSPFAGWRTNYGYSPQGGGKYGAQIGFNGGRHYGIDFGGKSGKTIRTPHGGQVVSSGWSSYGGGNQVEVYNKAMDKTFTFMHMLGDLAVKKGQTIQAGDKIGRMGSTGNSTGTHLHFQVNTGKGINNSRSINPSSYLTSGSNSVVGAAAGAASGSNISASSPSKLGKSISEKTAENLNAIEKAQLAAIEQSINKHNTGEENKSNVQKAKEDLDQMTLDRLKLMAEMRENDYAVIESYIEGYDVNQDSLNHKISELEYKADNAARKAGKTSDSDEWRKYMNKAKSERERQLKFQNQQVSYIQKVLNNDAKKSASQRMNEAHRFQLEEKLRDAKEQVVTLRRDIDEAETAILTSQTNQIMSQLDDQLAKIDKQITLVEHKRNFLDKDTQKNAEKYIKNLREEMKLQQKRDDQLDKAMKSLKGLRANLKQQPDLYQQVTDKIEEMGDQVRASELSLHEIKQEIKEIEKEIAQMKVDKLFKDLNKNLEKAQKNFHKFSDELTYINKEMQSDLYFGKQADILQEMKNYKDTIEDNIAELKKMEDEVKKFPEIHEQVTDELKNWEDQYKTVRQEMHTLRSEFTTDFISSIKEIYQTQKDLAIEAIDEEYSEFEKMINKKQKLIDDEATEERYNEDISDKQEELQKLRDEIAQRQGDDSLANQSKLKDLQEQLEDAEREYRRFVDDKERQRRKDALQEELDDAKESADNKKENTNKMFDDLLNDQRKFNEIQEEIMQGQVDDYKALYKELIGFVKDNVEDIGKSISEGMMDGITTPFEALKELSELLKEISGDDVKVPESGLKPIDHGQGDVLAELIKGVSNDTSLMNLGVTPSLSELNTNKPVNQSTTNNSNTFSSLVNIENFKGTQKEKDDLIGILEKEMRKQGWIK